MSEWLTDKATSKRMSKVKTSDTKPEVLLRSELWSRGRRFRKNFRRLPGSPDVAFTVEKVAVFVDGDFWHGRGWFEQRKLPSRNAELWREKFERNRERDWRVDAELAAMGWVVLRFWETEVKAHLSRIADSIDNVLDIRGHATVSRK